MAEGKRVTPEEMLAVVVAEDGLTPKQALACLRLQEALQTDPRLYAVLRDQCRRWQGRLDGPLTEFLAAAVGRV